MKLKENNVAVEADETETGDSTFQFENGVAMTHIPLENISNSKRLVYRDVDKTFVDELSHDIERNGLLNPITCWAGEQENSFLKLRDGTKIPFTCLVAGHHRRAALKALKERNSKRFNELFPNGIPVTLKVMSVKDALLCRLRENVQRFEESPESCLPVMVKLRDEFKMNQTQISRELGKSKSWVSIVYAIEEELGEEGIEALGKKEVTLRSAQKAAQEAKAAKKEGKTVTKAETLAKAKSATPQSEGRDRSVKRLSAKALYKRYLALPQSNLTMGMRIEILEGAFKYASGETEVIPKQLRHEPKVEKKSATPTKKVVAKK